MGSHATELYFIHHNSTIHGFLAPKPLMEPFETAPVAETNALGPISMFLSIKGISDRTIQSRQVLHFSGQKDPDHNELHWFYCVCN
jgi:hypothetical protein